MKAVLAITAVVVIVIAGFVWQGRYRYEHWPNTTSLVRINRWTGWTCSLAKVPDNTTGLPQGFLSEFPKTTFHLQWVECGR
jgi:hypothetical protein